MPLLFPHPPTPLSYLPSVLHSSLLSQHTDPTMLAERKRSPSPLCKLSLGSKISAFGAKLTRMLSPSDDNNQDEESDSVSPIISRPNAERSISRGREVFQSTGRGGIDNIRQASLPRDAPQASRPDDFSITRGREPVANPSQIFSTGRGGTGNLRSPSRDPKPRAEIEAAEEEVIREYVASQEGAIHSSSRGGIGNMSRSRLRDPTSTPKFSTGRGSAGNMIPVDASSTESIEEEERRIRNEYRSQHPLHSTGCGGAANITSTHEPTVERHPHHAGEFESTGRGGVGNIVSNRSSSHQRT